MAATSTKFVLFVAISYVLLINNYVCVSASTDDDQRPSGQHLNVMDEVNNATTNGSTPKRYQVISFDWGHVKIPFTVAIWIMIATVAKIGNLSTSTKYPFIMNV